MFCTLYRLKVALLSGVLMCSCIASQAMADSPPAVPDGQHDFDAHVGVWSTHVRRLRSPLTGDTEWLDYRGTTVVRSVLDGRANLAELRIAGNEGRIEGAALRLYEPVAKRWSINYVSAGQGVMTAPLRGTFYQGRGTFFGQDNVNGRIVQVRFLISAPTPDSYRFEQAYSADGGKTWQVNWIANDTRTAKAADDAPRDARQFARDFDQAQVKRDLRTLDRMVAPELVFIPGSGKLLGKQEFIDGYAAPTLRIEPIEIVRPTYVQLGNDAAVAGGEVVLRGTENGKPFASHFRFADTFLWRGGRWQVVKVQVTPIPPAP